MINTFILIMINWKPVRLINNCGKLKFLFNDSDAQNFKQTRSPIPFSRSLTSAVHIVEPSWERATNVNTTYNPRIFRIRITFIRNTSYDKEGISLSMAAIYEEQILIFRIKENTNDQLTVASSPGWWFLSQTWTWNNQFREII